MGSDVVLYIADPNSGAIASAMWLGGWRTAEKAHSVLTRPPFNLDSYTESWGSITEIEAKEIALEAYVDCAWERIDTLARQFPVDKYWWIIMHDQ